MTSDGPNHMTPYLILATLALAVSLTGASAQQAPYAGMQDRPLKALSSEQIGDLKAGRGMGLALAAELNGYPGPSHVLELGRELGLTEAQRSRVEALLAAMKAEAIPLGETLIAHERELDHQFAARLVTSASLAVAMDAIGTTQAKLRTAHLKYHLSMLQVLTPEQVQHYRELRGYSGPAPTGHAPAMHHYQAK